MILGVRLYDVHAPTAGPGLAHVLLPDVFALALLLLGKGGYHCEHAQGYNRRYNFQHGSFAHLAPFFLEIEFEAGEFMGIECLRKYASARLFSKEYFDLPIGLLA